MSPFARLAFAVTLARLAFAVTLARLASAATLARLAFAVALARLAFVAAAVLVALGCEPLSDKYRDGDFIFLRRNGADMPVWIRGNKGSDTFLVYLHGGPGGSALAGFASAPPFLAMRDQYGLVFWDQRASGMSQGNPPESSLTLEEFIVDTAQVIELIRSLYQPKHLVLMGHSWGGLLGTAYLLDATRQRGIDGWIEVDGSHSPARQYELSREWMLARAKQLRERGDDRADWNEVVAFYERTRELDPHTAPTHYRYCDAAGAYWFDERKRPEVTAADIFGSPFSLGLVINPARTAEAIGLTYGSTYDLSPRMNEIRIPALVLWGAEDGVIPAGMAEDAYRALGTAPEEKRQAVFEASAHSPMFEAPKEFEAEVRRFLENLRGARP